MTTSLFLSVSLASLATLGLGVGLLRILRLKDIPPTLLLGAGYGLGVVTIGKLLHLGANAGLALNSSSWMLVSLGLVAVGWEIRQRFFLGDITCSLSRQVSPPKISDSFRTSNLDPLILALLLLLTAHFAITLSNNVLRPIFPWDAFTTWMYRAKAWALQNSITPMASVNDWIAADGQSGYTLYASHYPAALSIYAAFMTALVGDWQTTAASLPWSLCLLSLCMSAHGLLVLAGVSNRLALIGAYLLGSMPLLNIHAALAGYGDLWMALYSGGGLAALLVWRISGQTVALWLALLILIAGTQIKTEGWLWLGLGLSFMILERIAIRIGYLKLLASLTLLAGALWGLGITSLTLGPLGEWGFDETYLHAGALGSYTLRPYNPAGSYWSIFFEQGNFLLLASFYLLALALISIKSQHCAASIWVMGSLIVGSQLIIFGLSAYSLYAETGTAVARIALHFTPVAAVSIILGWRELVETIGGTASQAIQPDHREASKSPWLGLAFGSTMLILALIAPLGLLATKASPSFKATSEQMIAVVGKTKNTTLGRQFIESPINVGVLKAPGKPPWGPTRYLRTNVTIANAESASFYWINEGETQANSTPMTLSGESHLDLDRFAAWRAGSKREIGFLIQTSEFGRTYFRDFSLSNHIDTSSLPAILNQWTAKEALTHKTVNNTLGHHDSPLSLTAWLTIGAALLAVVFFGVLFAQQPQLLGVVLGPTVLSLWAIAGTVTLVQTPLLDCLSPDPKCPTVTGDDPHAAALTVLAEEISANSAPETPILIVDSGNPLNAAKLPMLLLPRRAVQTTKSDAELLGGWSGTTVVLGSKEETIDQVADQILSYRSHGKVIRLDKAILFSGNP